MLHCPYAEMQLAAAQAEEEERTQAAAEAPVSIPADPAEDPAQPSGQSQDAPGQQPVAREQAGQGLQPTAPQPPAAPVRKSVKESGSRSTLRFAEAPTIATMSDEDDSVSGNARQSLMGMLLGCSHALVPQCSCAQGNTVLMIALELRGFCFAS